MTAKSAVNCGVGNIFIPDIEKGKEIDLPQSRSIEWCKEIIDKVLHQKADAQARMFAPTLPVETVSIKELEQEIAWRSKVAKYAMRAIQPRIHNYPIISAEPLTWRDDDGFPKLIILPVDSPGNVEISANERNWQYEMSVGDSESEKRYTEFIREVIYPCYGDVGLLLIKKSPYGGSISIKTSLKGLLLPKKTKNKIAAARAHFGHQLFVIAEAPQPWEVDVVVPPKPDPLIVGYDDGLLFLIDTFNLKRLEKVAAAEFTISS